MMSNTLDGYIIIMTVNYMFSNQSSFSSIDGYFFKDNSIYTNNPQFERDLAMYALNKADLVPCRAIKAADGSYACYRSDTGAFLTNISEDNFHIFNYELLTSRSNYYRGYFYAKPIGALHSQTRQIYFVKTDTHNLTPDLLQFINTHVFDNRASIDNIRLSMIPCNVMIGSQNGMYYFYNIHTGQQFKHCPAVDVHILQYKG